KRMVREPPSTLTRTEITAGFTFSTMSAKPTGRWPVSARALAANEGSPSCGAPGLVNSTAAPRPATLAISARRRAARRRRGRGAGVRYEVIWARLRPLRLRIGRTQRWDGAPYGVLSGALKFRNVDAEGVHARPCAGHSHS